MGTNLEAGLSWVRIPTGVRDISPNRPDHFWDPDILLQTENRGSLLEANWSVCEFDHVTPSNGDVKNEWS